ncbi:MAG: hypothetical protein ACI8S6_000020 [Myxococcota bacterium]|jgi:hypothetical protein
MLWASFLLSALAGTPSVSDATGPIVVDGQLDESDWARAEPVTDFVRYRPTPGGPPDGQTEVRFLQDDRHLYVGITVSGASYTPRARISPREDINDDDQVGIYIDTYGDGRTGYIFYFNPLGIQQDIRYANGNWVSQWDTVYASEGQATEDGYTIEIAFPFRSLRYPTGEPGQRQTWQIMLTRKLPHEGTKYSYPLLQDGHPQMFLQAVPLDNVLPAPRGAGLWVQPVLALRHQQIEDENGELAWTGLEPLNGSVRPGLDLRLGITPDVGAALTVNPDFSQVESDVRLVNLNQRFAFYYPEQRPFFLDGVDAFQDATGTLYTRSVVSPLYGVKLSGQEGQIALGALQSIDATPGASVHEDGAPGFSEADLDGAVASNSFGRLRLDALGSGYVGLTAADKRIIGGSDGYNDVLAVDLRVPFQEVWSAGADVSGSVTGADEVDPLVGAAGSAFLARTPNLGWGGSASASSSTPQYRREMGFLTQSGRSSTYAETWYRIGSERRTWTPSVAVNHQQEVDGDRYTSAVHSQGASLGVTNTTVSAGIDRRRQDEVTVDGWWTSTSWYGQLSKLLTLQASASVGRELDFGLLVPARSIYVSGGGNLRPSRGTRLDLDVVQQWFTPEESETARATRTFSRFTWQFTRPLGLRLNEQSTFISDGAASHSASVLLTWLQSPGREAYLGGTWNADDQLNVTEQTLFTKVTWLFQL